MRPKTDLRNHWQNCHQGYLRIHLNGVASVPRCPPAVAAVTTAACGAPTITAAGGRSARFILIATTLNIALYRESNGGKSVRRHVRRSGRLITVAVTLSTAAGDSSSRRSARSAVVATSAASITSTSATAGPDGGPRHGEVLEAVVDAKVGVLVRVLVRPRELHRRPRLAAPAVLHLDLHAGDVVLRLVDVRAVHTCNILVRKAGPERRADGESTYRCAQRE